MDTPITPICRANLMALASALAEARGVKLSTISRMCHSDPSFLEDFAKGKVSLTLRKYDSVIDWFSENWPADLPKPETTQPFNGAVAKPAAPVRAGLRRRRR